MKVSRLVALAAPLLMSWLVSAQDFANPVKQDNLTSAAVSAKPLRVLGRVSSDGNTLLTDIDSEWAISNAGALKGYEGLRVSIRCYVNSENGRIHVLSVRKYESDVSYASRHGDAAFRR